MTSDPISRIAVAMSGGVDSSVAAALLAEQGHEVIGLSMQLYDQRQGTETFGSCCSLDDLYDARRVAGLIGFPHYILNLEQQFQATVVANFVDEYAAGRTPIPCTHCNSDVKFATLLDRARGFGAEQVATGHYACRGVDSDGRWTLARSADTEKDQSYFLFALTQEQLARARFPLGTMARSRCGRTPAGSVWPSPRSRTARRSASSPTATTRPSSRGGGPTAATPGPIRDESGQTVGAHSGVHRFTIGQRKGLGLSAASPLYVTRIDPVDRSITVGPRQSLERTDLTASGVNWISGSAPAQDVRVTAQIRHRHTAAPATLRARPRESSSAHLRPTSSRHYTWSGRRVLRRQPRHRRRLDRLGSGGQG